MKKLISTCAGDRGHPTAVHTGSVVRIPGTRLNVNSYDDEGRTGPFRAWQGPGNPGVPILQWRQARNLPWAMRVCHQTPALKNKISMKQNHPAMHYIHYG